MKVLWTARSTATVTGISLSPGGLAVVVDRDSTTTFDAAGRRMAQLATAPQPAVDFTDRADIHIPVPRHRHVRISAQNELLTVFIDGTPLERFATVDGITAVAADDDGTSIVVGTGSGIVHSLRITAAAGSASTFLAAEEQAIAETGTELPTALVRLYQTFGGAVFAVHRLRHAQDRRLIDSGTAHRSIAMIALEHAEALHADPRAAFEAAGALADEGNLGAAIDLFRVAAATDDLASAALHATGDCFRSLGAFTAADIVYRRAAAAGPDATRKQAIYQLGRLLEDGGHPIEAAEQYQLLIAWDPAYRDVWARWEKCRAEPADSDLDGRRADVDAPPLVRRLHDLDDRGLFTSTPRSIAAYDAWFYQQFDNTLPQDTIKKQMEMAYVLDAIDATTLGTSLDVGSGTLRYPQILAAYGVDSYGIDLRDSGIHACVDRRWHHRFAVADGTALPFRDGSFDLITCMMGTINHLTPTQRRQFFAESVRALRPGGQLIVSAWDPACTFQTFLSYYSPTELAQLRTSLTPPTVLVDEVRAAGFAATSVTSFVLFEEWMTSGPSLPDAPLTALSALLELDTRQRSSRPDQPGQMFMVRAVRD